MSLKRLAILACLFVIGIILLANNGQGEFLFRWVNILPGGDFTGHILIMGTLSFFLNLGMRSRTVQVGNLNILSGSLILIVLLTLEECSQNFLANRTFSLMDLTANYIGVIAFGYLAQRIYQTRLNQEAKESW